MEFVDLRGKQHAHPQTDCLLIIIRYIRILCNDQRISVSFYRNMPRLPHQNSLSHCPLYLLHRDSFNELDLKFVSNILFLLQNIQETGKVL